MKPIVMSYVEGMRLKNLDGIGPRNGRRFLVCDISRGVFAAVRWANRKPKRMTGNHEAVLYFSKQATGG